jgi:putative nucleotidyltransferase with HDIG domain
MVNSAFFGLRRSISDSREAVEFLGLDTISSLTLGLGIISQFEHQHTSNVLAELWSHSMAVGVMASKIARGESRETADDAFTAGLLHDLGRVVLAVNLPQEFQAAEEMILRDDLSISQAEKEVFGATHAEVGAFLLGLWGLPAQVVEAVAFHSKPSESNDEAFTPLTAVHAANVIQRFQSSEDPRYTAPNFDMKYLDSLGLRSRTLFWQEKCAAFSANIA